MGQYITRQIAFQPPRCSYDKNMEGLRWVEGVPVHVFTPRRFQHNCFTIIYSHGNSTDLGEVLFYMKEIAQTLNCRMIIYDYEGYGLRQKPDERAPSLPTEGSCYVDLERVVNYALNDLQTKSNRLILYGTSLGSGPTTHMAMKLCNKKRRKKKKGENYGLAGVILESPFKSCVRVVSEGLSFIPFTDMFDNFKKIGNITVPIFILHGTKDEVVPYYHGKDLYKASKTGWHFLSIEDAGHNDLHLHWNSKIKGKMTQFLDHLKMNA